MINFEYSRVSTVEAALQVLRKNPGAAFIAGGTNLVDLMKRGVAAPTRLIDINGIALKQLSLQKNKVGNYATIGALALNSQIAEHEDVTQYFPLLAMALRAGASPQLRNMATVGGNMMQRTRCTYFYDTVMPCNKRKPGSGCSALKGYNRMHAIFGASDSCIAVHPSDMCVALTALNANVELQTSSKTRVIPFRQFHRLPGTKPEQDNTLIAGEMITQIHIPFNNYTHSYYLKIRDRASYAFALVSVAAALELQGNTIQSATLAMGGVAHKPWFLDEPAAWLVGRPATKKTFEEAAKLAMNGAKGYGENNFKLKLAPAAIIDALENCVKAKS
jgi:xanthine dehydrogenase YagS FAD-binding subunit